MLEERTWTSPLTERHARWERRRRVNAAFVWLVLPMVLLAMTVEGAQQLRPSWRAHRGAGTSGTFTVTRCVKLDCFGGGVWTADDGSRTRRGVRLYDAPLTRHQVGDRIPALDTGLPYGVYVARGESYRTTTAELLLGALGLAACLVALALRFRRRRAQTP